MKEEFQIETFRPGDVSILAGFLREEYPDGEIADVNFLKWEYGDNPFGKAFISLARDEHHNIASQYAVIPVQVVVDGEILKGSLSLNTLTAKNFRGKGLFVKTAENNYRNCLEDGVAFTFGVPNSNSFPGFIKRLQFTHAGNLIFAVKPLRPFNILKSFWQNTKVKKGKDISLTLDEPSLAMSSVSLLKPETDHEQYEYFWNDWKRKNKVLLNRSLEYMSWRYLENPLRKYHLLKLVENDRMMGLVVIRPMNIFGMKVCVIMDFFSLDDFHGSKLLRALSAEMKSGGLDIMISASAGDNGIYACIKKSGFMKVPRFLMPQQLPFILRTHKEFKNADWLFDLRNWHFTFGDYDIF